MPGLEPGGNPGGEAFGLTERPFSSAIEFDRDPIDDIEPTDRRGRESAQRGVVLGYGTAGEFTTDRVR